MLVLNRVSGPLTIFIFATYFLSSVFSQFFEFWFDGLPHVLIGFFGSLYLIVNGRIPRSGVYLSWLFLSIYLLLSSCFYDNPAAVVRYGILFIFYSFGVLLFVRFFYSIFEFYRALKFFLIGQLFFCFIGMIDVILYVFGYVSIIRDYTLDFRVDSFYKNPNPFGIVSALCIGICFLLRNHGMLNRTQLVGYISILFASALLSLSSMALVISIGIVCSWYIRLHVKYLFVLVFGFVILVALVTPDIWMVVLNKRFEIWMKAFDMWSESTLIGIGTGNFQLLNESFYSGDGIGSSFGLHSMLIWSIVEIGLIGFSFIMFFFWVCFKSYSKEDSYLYTIFFYTVLSQVTEFFLDHEELFSLLFMLLISGIIAISRRTPNTIAERESKYA